MSVSDAARNYIRSKIDIASVPPPSRHATFFHTRRYFYRGSFLLLGLLLLFHTRREIIFYPFVPSVTPIITRKYVVHPPRVFKFVHNYYRAATGLNVASVLCANRLTLFFDVCNICYGKILMRDEKGGKKNRQGISPGRRPSRRKFFSARPALLLRVQQRYTSERK